MNRRIPLQNRRIWKILESFESYPFSVHLEIKCRSPFQFCSLAQPCLSFHFRKTGGSRAALVFIIIRADAPPWNSILFNPFFARMAFYARCTTSFSFSPKHLPPFPSPNAPPLSKQVALLLLSLSLFPSFSLHRYEQTDLCFWQFASRGRMRKLASGTLRRWLDAPCLENGNNERGERGAPLLTRFAERGRKRGTEWRDRGLEWRRLCRFRFFRESFDGRFLLSSGRGA